MSKSKSPCSLRPQACRLKLRPLHPLNGGPQELGGILAGEFFLNAGPVDLDGPGAEIELLGDFPRGESLSQAVEDFQFAGGEALDAAAFCAGVAFDVGAQETFADVVADVQFSLQDGAQGSEELHVGIVFHDIALGAGAQGLFGVGGLVVHGENEDGEVWEWGGGVGVWEYGSGGEVWEYGSGGEVWGYGSGGEGFGDFLSSALCLPASDFPDEIQSAPVLKDEVDDGDVGLQVADGLQRFIIGPGLAAQDEILGPGQQDPHTVTDDRVVVDDQDAEGLVVRIQGRNFKNTAQKSGGEGGIRTPGTPLQRTAV